MNTKDVLLRFLKRNKPQQTAEDFLTQLEKLGRERQGIINITPSDRQSAPEEHEREHRLAAAQ